MAKFSVIYIDPPWPYKVYSEATGNGRSAESHYKTMTWEDLAALGPYINAVAEDVAAMCVWVCPPSMIQAALTVEAWGWDYKTKFKCWLKTYRDGKPFVGMGHYTRSNTEDCLLFTRRNGDGKNPSRLSKSVLQVLATYEQMYAQSESPTIVSVVQRHSEKPLKVAQDIQKLFEGPYLEVFARDRKPGWVSLGNELDGLDITESLQRLAQDDSLPVVQPVGPSQLALFGADV